MNMSDTVLLCMDLQNDLVLGEGKMAGSGLPDQVAARDLLATVQKLQGVVRSYGGSVAHVRVAYRADYGDNPCNSPRGQRLRDTGALIEGTWGSAIYDQVAPLDDEMIFTKHAVNPFFNTDLMTWLNNGGVRHLILCGVATNMVVESAARYADDAGFKVTVVEDACASFREDWHEFSTNCILPLIGRVASSSDLIKEISK